MLKISRVFKRPIFIIKLILGLGLLLGLVLFIGGLEDPGFIFNFDWRKSWLVLIATAVINLIAALRWYLILTGSLSFSGITFFKLFRIVMLGRIVGTSTHQLLGDVGSRSLYLKSEGHSLQYAGVSIVTEKLLEGLMFLSVVVVFCLSLLDPKGMIPLWFFVFASILLLFLLTRFVSPIVAFIERFFKHPQAILKEMSSQAENLGLALVFLTALKYLSVTLRFLIIFHLCSINLDLMKCFWGTACAQLGLMVGITPGGLGFVEAGWTGALHFYDIDPVLITRFLIVQRLLITISIVLLFLTVTIWERVEEERK
ncbi:lysylphosphatidylglycerol synthase transmembrane domain-containing protein [Thermodesulfobacteriota bacterium]